MARNAVASIGNLRFGRQRTDDRRGEKASRSCRASPPQSAAGRGAGLAVVGHHRAVERAVERREHAALDEVEGGGLAVARSRQIPPDLLVDPARTPPHPHPPAAHPHPPTPPPPP